MYLGLILLAAPLTIGAKWPYNRTLGREDGSGAFVPDRSHPDLTADERENFFVRWLHNVSESLDSGEVKSIFMNNSIPRNVSIKELLQYIEAPPPPVDDRPLPPLPPNIPSLPVGEADRLFRHLNYPIDPRCTVDKSRWWYRTYDGSCNWLKQGEISAGQIGTAKRRDYNQHAYADGISKPREGPNPRAVSNAFFKRKKRIDYEHTPLLIGLIEWVMHDVTYSMDSTSEEDAIEVPVPDDEMYYPKNTTFQVWRTKAVPGTGTSKSNPRENVNMATTWLDLSSLYGSTPEVAKALRSFDGGRLLTQEVQARGERTFASYLPFNTMNVPMRTRPDVDPKTLFAGGDPRTNEDWLMLGVHTLFLREHNRLCGILETQHPEYDDEQLYQTARLALTAKYALMANSYQMAYWTEDMPWPTDDGFPLYRQMYGKDFLDINPMNTYPWPLVTKGGKPMVVSAEMAVVYRFHEFIISEFPIKDKMNNTLWNQSVFDTGFNATGFIDAGLENVLRGSVAINIPNFKSGVDESFRSAGKYRGKPFDIVVWSIVHEREQGLPTFNEYFRKYNEQDPAVEVPIRNTFSAFSKDPQVVKDLENLYKTPDDVDLVVGVQLDDEKFPGTTVPKSALIISLFSLFGMGNSDRFSIGFAATKCLLVDKPWDCHPTNALEELLWKPRHHPDHPNFRWLDNFWLTELDFQAHGTNLLWRLVTENSNIKCLQQRPLFPTDPETNPILCALPKPSPKDTIWTAIISGLEVVLALYRQRPVLYTMIFVIVIGTIILLVLRRRRSQPNMPPVLRGWPILGEALSFNKDPKTVLLKGFSKYGESLSRSFGIKLASQTHFVITQPKDIKLMIADNPYEAKFSLHAFFAAINVPLIVHKDNFDSDLHTKLIARHLGDSDTLAKLGSTIMQASNKFIGQLPKNTAHLDNIIPTLMKYITSTVAGCIVGYEAQDIPELLDIFTRFNDDSIKAMGLSSLLPSFLQFLAGFSIESDYRKARKILIPIIQNRRRLLKTEQKLDTTFLDFILGTVDDDVRAADLVVIVVWVGLTNLQATFTSLVMDIINAPDSVKTALIKNLSSFEPSTLNVFDTTSLMNQNNGSQEWSHQELDQHNEWTPLRAALFESVRLSGPITGPARLLQEDVMLPSSHAPGHIPQILPKSKVATLSAYYIHRSTEVYGENAAIWDSTRFLHTLPAIGSPDFVSWGLTGPHMCPGRWFAQECILIMTSCLLGSYDITPDRKIDDDEKYIYTSAGATRKDVGVTISVIPQSG